MISWIILLIKQFIDIIRYLFIADVIFDLEYNRKKKIKEAIILTIIIIFIYIILFPCIEQIWVELNLIICLNFLIIFYKAKLIKKVKIITVTMLIATLLEQFVDLFFRYNWNEYNSYEFLFSNFFKLSLIVILTQLIKLIRTKKTSLSNISWYIYMNIFFGFSATLMPLFVAIDCKNDISSRLYTTIIIIAYANIIISLISIFLFIKNKNQKDTYYLQNKMKDQTLKLQEDYYACLIDNYSNLRRFKHDIKGHLAVVNGLINKKEYKDASSYINQISNEIKRGDAYKTNNLYVSTILNSFDQKFKDNKIDFNLAYSLMGDFKIDTMDICSLFYNLVLNALEANLKLEDNRYIKLSVTNIKKHVVIKLINPINQDFDMNLILDKKTSKDDKENHGLGLTNITNIIEKYQGSIDYQEVNNQLITNITLLNVINR